MKRIMKFPIKMNEAQQFYNLGYTPGFRFIRRMNNLQENKKEQKIENELMELENY